MDKVNMYIEVNAIRTSGNTLIPHIEQTAIPIHIYKGIKYLAKEALMHPLNNSVGSFIGIDLKIHAACLLVPVSKATGIAAPTIAYE